MSARTPDEPRWWFAPVNPAAQPAEVLLVALKQARVKGHVAALGRDLWALQRELHALGQIDAAADCARIAREIAELSARACRRIETRD